MFDWRDTLKEMRSVVHRTMGRPRVSVLRGGVTYPGLTVRFHEDIVSSGNDEEGWAERFAAVPHLIFDGGEFSPERGDVVTLSDDSKWKVLEVYPPKGAFISCDVAEA